MTMIVHISDLHFAADNRGELSPGEALAKATAALGGHMGGSDVHLVVSGDITTKGRPHGYDSALAYLREFVATLRPSAVMVVPGNHDISPSPKGFEAFNRFAFSLTHDDRQMFDVRHPVVAIEHGEFRYLLVNSAYHLDHQYGQVPIDALKKELEASMPGQAIIVMHHSPISSVFGGNALSNAYDFLALAGRYKARAVLHGHIHGSQVLEVGGLPTMLAGTGSLGFRPDANMNNQFGVYALDSKDGFHMDRYVYEADRAAFFKREVGAL